MACKRDCFAWTNKGCGILKEVVCALDKCPFYKTKEQAEADKRKAQLRLARIAVDVSSVPTSVSESLGGKKLAYKQRNGEREKKAEYLRNRRKELAEKGYCPVCGKVNDRPGKSRCTACMERGREYRKARKRKMEEN